MSIATPTWAGFSFRSSLVMRGLRYGIDRKHTAEQAVSGLMLEQLRAGDTIIVWRLDRLARSTRDLLETMEAIREGGARFRSLSNRGLTRQPMPAS